MKERNRYFILWQARSEGKMGNHVHPYEHEGYRMLRALPEHPVSTIPLIFLHGASCGAWSYTRMMEYFCERGYPCYAFNNVGHGERSNEDHQNFGVQDYFLDTLTCLMSLCTKEGYHEPHVIGHSMGGLVTQLLLEARVVHSATLIAPAPPKGVDYLWGRTLSFGVADMFNMAMSVLFGNPFRPGEIFVRTLFKDPNKNTALIREFLDRMIQEPPRVLADMFFNRIPVNPENINAPMLVIGAEFDSIIRSNIANIVAEFYGATFREVPLGHMCMMEDGWEETAEICYEWIKRCDVQ